MNFARTRDGLGWRGVVAAAAAGGWVGLIDVARALVPGRELIQARSAVDVVLFYTLCFAPCGLVAVFAARLFKRPLRALQLLVVMGAAFFLGGAWLNVSVLPRYASGLAIAADIALLTVTGLSFQGAYRAGSGDNMRVGQWIAAGAAAFAIAFGASAIVPVRGDGDTPPVAVADVARRPNVLIYLCDTLRADHLGCYGYKSKTSPEIDAFAREATLFSDCRTVTSWTKPAVASLFTSLYPGMHGCSRESQVLAPEFDTIAETFRAAGWRTMAFVDNPFISPEFGFGQGFAASDFHCVSPSVIANGTLLGRVLFMSRVLSLGGEHFGVGGSSSQGTATLQAEFLAACGQPDSAPWFAYIHAMDPHLPYEPSAEDASAFGLAPYGPFAVPPAFSGLLPFDATPDPGAELLADLTSAYDGEVRGFSRHFGALMSELAERNLLEDTIVILLADHGEEFHEHGGWTHGHSLYREVSQVPMIVRLPASLGDIAQTSRGVSIGGVASLLDVFPTLLELCSIGFPGGNGTTCGVSLVGSFGAEEGRADSGIADRIVLGEVAMYPGSVRALRWNRWQLIVSKQAPHGEAVALYDDVSDPAQAHDRATELPAVVQRLRAEMNKAFGACENGAVAGADQSFDPDTAKRLRSLGYVNVK